MTPGFAKSRRELFWLPYPEPDKVIINAHNFQSAWTPAVNGKTPISAWVPSRDTAGNGTATLNDLSGGNNGTLTNMDPASDWVSDTDSGGVRALDFDGSNDYVTIPHNSVLNPGSNPFSISCWIKPPNANQFSPILQKRNADGGIGQVFALAVAGDAFNAISGKKVSMTLLWNSTAAVRSFRTVADVADGNWHHLSGIWTGSEIQIWVDGINMSLASEFATGPTSTPMAPSGPLRIGVNTLSGGAYFRGRQDDIRLFYGYQLDSTDIAALYASGSGRGVQE
jgi:hypothetical protein